MKNLFEENVKVRYSEMDQNLVLKPSALFNFLQDLASENAENLNFGYSYIKENNLAWFLLKYHMEFSDYPEGKYELNIKTEPRGYNKLFAFRDFEIISEDKVLGRVASMWSLIDVNSRGIVPIQKVLADNPHMVKFEKRPEDLNYEKIPSLEKIDIEKTYETRFDDIDVNRHVNNANYIVWALEPLGFEFRDSKKLKTLDVVFKKEMKYGDKVVSKVEICGDKTVHLLKSLDTDEELCAILAFWVNK